eukprot:1155329-Pelagomonas_calceolata.AAC.6
MAPPKDRGEGPNPPARSSSRLAEARRSRLRPLLHRQGLRQRETSSRNLSIPRPGTFENHFYLVRNSGAHQAQASASNQQEHWVGRG